MIMTDEQKLKYDLLKECGYDFNKAQKAYEWIMDISEESPSAQEVCADESQTHENENHINDDPCTQFDYKGDYCKGFVPVESKGKWNFINAKGEYLSDTWYDDAWDFREGLALIKSKGKWNFINDKCEYLSDTWFDDAWNFFNGRALVKLNGERFYIDKEGKRV